MNRACEGRLLQGDSRKNLTTPSSHAYPQARRMTTASEYRPPHPDFRHFMSSFRYLIRERGGYRESPTIQKEDTQGRVSLSLHRAEEIIPSALLCCESHLWPLLRNAGCFSSSIFLCSIEGKCRKRQTLTSCEVWHGLQERVLALEANTPARPFINFLI